MPKNLSASGGLRPQTVRPPYRLALRALHVPPHFQIASAASGIQLVMLKVLSVKSLLTGYDSQPARFGHKFYYCGEEKTGKANQATRPVTDCRSVGGTWQSTVERL